MKMRRKKIFIGIFIICNFGVIVLGWFNFIYLIEKSSLKSIWIRREMLVFLEFLDRL